MSLGAGYELRFCGTAETVATAQGLALGLLEPLPEPRRHDLVIVPGFRVREAAAPGSLVAWLRRADAAGAEVCSVCTGAFLLAEAGLLDGRRCTTHWKRVAELQERCPRAKVVPDRLFVQDRGITTSAGIASGIDMALCLLERDHGPLLAARVAREMVVYMRRDGAHAQASVYLDYRTHLDSGVHEVQDHLVAHPESRATLRELARIGRMSERSLTRAFRVATGVSIHRYRTRLRLERARTLLNDPGLKLEAVAERCGFADARQLRRLWRANGLGPMRRRVPRPVARRAV